MIGPRETEGRRAVRLYRAEGPHTEPGYAGRVDVRTGRYFGTLARALAYCTDDRHLFEVDVEDMLGNPDDHVLLNVDQAARKVHSDRCPCLALDDGDWAEADRLRLALDQTPAGLTASAAAKKARTPARRESGTQYARWLLDRLVERRMARAEGNGARTRYYAAR